MTAQGRKVVLLALQEASRALMELDPLARDHDAVLIDEALKALLVEARKEATR